MQVTSIDKQCRPPVTSALSPCCRLKARPEQCVSTQETDSSPVNTVVLFEGSKGAPGSPMKTWSLWGIVGGQPRIHIPHHAFPWVIISLPCHLDHPPANSAQSLASSPDPVLFRWPILQMCWRSSQALPVKVS